jgi:hypothetical protein
MPSSYPDIFIGGTVGLGFIYDEADFSFSNNYILCTNFDNGSGYNYSFGIKSEYWLSADRALNVAISYSSYNSTFSNTQSWIAIADKEYFKTFRYNYEAGFSYLNTEINYKYRFLPNHYFISAGLSLDFALTRENIFSEEVVSPSELKFKDGTRKHIIAYGDIAPTRAFAIIPKVKAGYDLDLGKSMYASIAVVLGMSAFSVLEDEDWNRFVPGIEISVYRGMFLKK